MNTNTIQIEFRNVYGNTLAYPACDIAKGFAEVAKSKTLTLHDLRIIDRMGFTVFLTAHGSVIRSINPQEMRELSNAI